MKAFRLNRLFHPDSKRCFGVALDGSFPGGSEPTHDDKALAKVIGELSEIRVDALRLNLEQAEYLQRIPGKQRPALILRADVTNAFKRSRSDRIFCRIVGNIAEQALRLDAAAIAIHLIAWPEHPEVRTQCLENLHELRGQCDRWCLPLVVDDRSSADGQLQTAIDADLAFVKAPPDGGFPPSALISSNAALMLEQPLTEISASLEELRHCLTEYHGRRGA